MPMNSESTTDHRTSLPFTDDTVSILPDLIQALDGGFDHLPDYVPYGDLEGMQSVLEETMNRMRNNYPYHHPLYAGQMLKPPHPVARMAYTMALWINPNNHALDGGRASSAMEKEAVAGIARMFGFGEHLGHLCGGGTMANMEALWIAGRLRPEASVAASSQAHYTHSRISEVLGITYRSVPTDEQGRMDVDALARLAEREEIGTVVATMGTTGLGAVDPLHDILECGKRYGFRVHADAAYGGYYTLASNLLHETRKAFDALSAVDSIVIDPHKHGLQPYGCGCVLFSDPSVGAHYRHDSPYTYFTSEELHLGEISLECSRPGAAAVALWSTMRLLPPEREGRFAADLERCRRAALQLCEHLDASPNYRRLLQPELDIVVWGPSGTKGSEIGRHSREIFDRAAERDLHLALIDLPSDLLAHHWPDVDFDEPSVTCLRSCLMKPEHLDWIDRISSILEEAARG